MNDPFGPDPLVARASIIQLIDEAIAHVVNHPPTIGKTADYRAGALTELHYLRACVLTTLKSYGAVPTDERQAA